ncbi:hypothetical protein SLS62_000861 [Diatrype stigma]|uniref:DUF4048 domain-containing protein n=1 Tax=Diatrype stigma TaxID=117547 RepID=A0AAN9YUC4_9PEZI
MAIPPTPLEASAVKSPTDPNQFIVAIAAQERRVLELREELSLAEGELRRLKKQFTAAEGYKKRVSQRNNDLQRAMSATGQGQGSYEESSATQRTSELERRKAILLAQSKGAPREYKRTVIRGGHARTLSLLSPARPATEFPLLEDLEVARRSIDSAPQHDWKPRSATTINKRATWAPRQTQPPNGVKQIANDFRQGLWTFVEDLRQATVGDEAISGNFNRTSEMVARLNRPNSGSSHDQDTIRASSGTPTTNRGRIPFPTETSSENNTPIRSNFSSSGSFNERLQQQQKERSNGTSQAGEPAAPAAAVTKARKHFSWTPLTFDQFDDDDWSNWDTPTVKQSRWSGSTVNGDIIPAPVSDRSDENEATL